MYLFETLETYRKAVQLAAIVELTAKDFPKSAEYFSGRLIRSANLIHESIAEANSKWKREERKSLFWRARGLIQECFGLVDIAFRQGFLSPNLSDQYRIKLDALNKEIQDSIRGTLEWANEGKLSKFQPIEHQSSKN